MINGAQLRQIITRTPETSVIHQSSLKVQSATCSPSKQRKAQCQTLFPRSWQYFLQISRDTPTHIPMHTKITQITKFNNCPLHRPPPRSYFSPHVRRLSSRPVWSLERTFFSLPHRWAFIQHQVCRLLALLCAWAHMISRLCKFSHGQRFKADIV